MSLIEALYPSVVSIPTEATNRGGPFDFLGNVVVVVCRPSFSLLPEKTGYLFQQLENQDHFFRRTKLKHFL